MPNKDYKTWLSTLFDANDNCCTTNTVYGTQIYSRLAIEISEPNNFIALNPLHNSRADGNVVLYRNILIELDKGSIAQQMNKLQKSGIPYSSVVYSGGKSLHIIISLREPLLTRGAYESLVNLIYKVFDPKQKWVDPACKNPSRLTRAPFALRRKDDGSAVEQALVELKARVDNDILDDWIVNKIGLSEFVRASCSTQDKLKMPRVESILKNVGSATHLDTRFNSVSRRAEAFLTWGSDLLWLREAFYTASELARCGYDEDEIMEMIERVDGYLDRAAETAVRNAVKKSLTSGEYGSKLNEEV